MWRYWAFFLPAIIHYGIFFGISQKSGGLEFVWANLFFIFGCIPFLDFLGSRGILKFEDADARHSLNEMVVVLLSLPLQVFSIFFFAWYVGNHTLNAIELVACVINAGILSALYAQNPAHELIHHGSRFERFFGICLFSTSCYTGAKLAHIHSHHLLVATPQDPTSARYGQSLYAYLPKAIAVNLFGWWGANASQSNSYFRKKALLENSFGYALSLAWALLILFLFGGLALSFFIVQSCIGILVLEMMNYIGHYGLRRSEDTQGKLARVTEHHAWDCDLPFSNLVLISVQKHADHHINPHKSYAELVCISGSPRLPISYPLLFLLSLFPPFWRALIHPRLLQFQLAAGLVARDGAQQ